MSSKDSLELVVRGWEGDFRKEGTVGLGWCIFIYGL